jgi:phosphoserine phosphatase RsbU/P
VFYTDGVTERHGQEQLFGEEGLRAIIAAHAGQSARSIVSAIEQAATAGRTNPDDMAIVVIRIPE